MRVLNLVGSVLSVVYGVILGIEGIGMIILNGTLIFVNAYYLYKAFKKEPKKEYVDVRIPCSNYFYQLNCSDGVNMPQVLGIDFAAKHICPKCGAPTATVGYTKTDYVYGKTEVRETYKCDSCNTTVEVYMEDKQLYDDK